MNNSIVVVTLLREAYEAYFSPKKMLSLSDEKRWSMELIDDSIKDMVARHLIVKGAAGGPTGRNLYITPSGVLKAENNGVAPHDLHQTNLRVRQSICDYLATQKVTTNVDLGSSLTWGPEFISSNVYVLELMGRIQVKDKRIELISMP